MSQTWAALVAGLRESPYRLERWVSESEARADHDLVEDPDRPDLEGTALIPDAHFVLHRPDGRLRAYFLEIDLGTEVLARIRPRIETYEHYRGGQFAARYGMSAFTLVFIADGATRLAGIRRTARSVIGTESVERYLFGTLDALRPERVLGPIWASASGEARRLVE